MPSSDGPTVPLEFAALNVWQPPQPASAKTAAPSALSPPSVSVSSVVAASVVAPSVAVSAVVWVSAAARRVVVLGAPAPDEESGERRDEEQPDHGQHERGFRGGTRPALSLGRHGHRSSIDRYRAAKKAANSSSGIA